MPTVRTPGPVGGILDRIHEHARARAGRPAVQDAVTELTYGELADQVDRLGDGLRRLGARRADRVGIHLANSAQYVIAVLACLQVGVVFVPIPFADPEDRIRRIGQDARLRLTVVPGPRQFSSQTVEALRPVAFGDVLARGRPDPGAAAGPDSPAEAVYIVYTSGSTGDPKGAVIRRESLHNLVGNTIDVFGMSADTRALCLSPFHFDGAFGSLFSVLVAGGSLVVAGHGPILPGDFFRLLVEQQITHTSCSPTLLRLMVSSRDLPRLADSPLRTIGLGGENWTRDDVRPLFEHRPELTVVNRYGPTETTVVVASHRVDRAWCAGTEGPIPLGRPDPGVAFHLVDRDGQLITSTGTVGELCVSGVQVMTGYWGAPELTATVLRDDLIEGTTVYRTGDLVLRRDDGLYVYVDRADSVVKRNGNRVSMSEITAALLRVPGVQDAVSLVDSATGRPAIRTFVVTSAVMTGPEVREHLLRTVPPYMNPDSLILLDAIPRTSSGKPDLQRLKG